MTAVKSQPKSSIAAASSAKLQRIIVATDFSENADVALRWAMELARAHGAQIVLVHAWNAGGVVPSALGEQQLEQIRRELTHAEVRVKNARLRVAVEAMRGRPWEVINEIARKTAADLIVIGTKGHSTFSRLLLGSTADRVIRTASAPVLVVHPNDQPPATGVQTILVAVDFSEESALATSAAYRLLSGNEHGGRLVLMHSVELLIEWPTPNLPMVTPQFWDEAEQTAKRQLESLAAPLRSDRIQVETRTCRGYASISIEQEIRAVKADLIAMGTRGRTGLDRFLLGSVAQNVLHHAPVPVLTVRKPDPNEPIRISPDNNQA